MAATVQVREHNTVSNTPTDKSAGTFRYKKTDDANVDANNPLVKPASGNDRSYEKWARLYIGATGPTGSITSPTFYTDGANGFGTGISAYARTTNPGSTFATPVIPANDSAGTDMFTYVTGARKALDAIVTGPFTATTADFGDYLVMWMTLATTVSAPQNPTASETLTFAWNET